jgi:hypothetical protein
VQLCNRNYQPLDILELGCERTGKNAPLLTINPKAISILMHRWLPKKLKLSFLADNAFSPRRIGMRCSVGVYAQSPIAHYNPGSSSTNLPNGT